MRVAVVTSRWALENHPELLQEDQDLRKALAALPVRAPCDGSGCRGPIDPGARQTVSEQYVPWDGEAVDWSAFDVVIVRSAWDYQKTLPQFLAWVAKVDNLVPCVLNDAKTLAWNADKAYLRDLEAAGLPIVPTKWLDPKEHESGAAAVAASLAAFPNAGKLVLKPAVSASADDTFVVMRDVSSEGDKRLGEWLDQSAAAERVHQLLVAEQRVLLAQPFLECVQKEGELSLIALDGKVTHAIRKVSRDGDFRVQEEHGGRNIEVPATPVHLSFAADALRAVEKCGHSVPAYARIDIMFDDTGKMLLGELEMLEPALLSRDTSLPMHAPETLARVVANRWHARTCRCDKKD